MSEPISVDADLSSGAQGSDGMRALTVRSSTPRREMDWKGLSGTALLDESSGRLLGIVSKTRDSSANDALRLTLLADFRDRDMDGFWKRSELSRPAPAQLAGSEHSGGERASSLKVSHRTTQEALLRRHELFGGRDAELDCLSALLRGSPNAYHFIWGPGGFGKSALLANWIAGLVHGTTALCFHFINRLEGTADEATTLRSLCEQLATCHNLTIELSSPPEVLRQMFVQLLKRPRLAETPLVVVIDGIDEATGWTPGSV